MAARIQPELRISQVARFPGLRALAWDGNVLYASRGYDLLSAVADDNPIRWQTVARYSAPMWRNLTVRSRLTLRLFRDGFHALAVLSSGNQQARAVALVTTREALYFSSDTPFETNHIYRYSRRGILSQVAELNGSSIYGCRVGEAIFFSTMVEPSAVNRDRHVRIYGSADQASWDRLLEWKKDIWAMGSFQYGNAFLPDGGNTTNLLAITTVAVKKDDLQTTLWRV